MKAIHLFFGRFACLRTILANPLSILLLTSLFLPGVQAGQLDHWHWRSPAPFANRMLSLAFGAGKFVAVGDDGIIHLSADGTAWDDGHRPITQTLFNVIYVNNQFVAVGDHGAIITSPDGFTWTQRVSGATNAFLAVTYGNGKYLACGVAGQIAFSSDGITWSPGHVGTNDLKWAAAGNGSFILPITINVLYNETAKVLVSTDGVSWNAVTVFTLSANAATPPLVHQVEYANGQFIAVVQTAYLYDISYIPVMRYYSSPDGNAWTQGAAICTDWVHAIPTFLSIGDGALWTAIGYYSIVASTTDGSSASNSLTSDAGDMNGFAYGNGNYVMAGNTGKVLTSTSGTNWTAAYVTNAYRILQMAQGPNGYLAVSYGGPIFNSTDGLTFKALASSPLAPYTGIAYDGSNVVAVAEGGGLYTSADGNNWTQRNSNSGGQSLRKVTRGAARWVAVGDAGTIITSPSGSAWTLRFSGTANNLHGVAYGNSLYVAVGDGGNILTSSDGATWDVQDSGTIGALYQVQYLNGQFYAVGAQGTILSSPDGVTWTSQNSGVGRSLNSVAYGNGMYVAAGSDFIIQNTGFDYTQTVLLQSTNGINWQDISTNLPVSVGLDSLAFLGGSFWLTADSGSILQSDSVDGQPVLAGAMLTGSGAFRLNVALNAPDTYTIQAKNSLNSGWQDASSVTNPVITHTWTDTNAPASPARFYRIKSTQ